MEHIFSYNMTYVAVTAALMAFLMLVAMGTGTGGGK